MNWAKRSGVPRSLSAGISWSDPSMFRLLRYFSIMSLIGMVLGTLLLVFMYRYMAVKELIAMGESKSVALTQAFANSLRSELSPFLISVSELSGDDLRAHAQIAKLRQAVQMHMKGLSVAKIKLYSLSGLTVFSTEAKQIGEDKSTNAGFLSARSGKVISDLVHRDSFNAFDQIIEDRDLLQTYIPFRREQDAPIEGVFELYDDVTPFLQTIKDTQKRVIFGVIAVFMFLYGFLFFVVGHADRVIKRQEVERRRVEEEIRKMNAELEQRVSERTAELTSANAALMRANKVKDEFLSVMSHELRTPLNAVVGYAAMIKDGIYGEITSAQNKALEKMIRRAKDQLIMIGSILRATQMEGEGVKLVRRQFSLRDFLDELKSSYDVPLDKELTFHWNYCTDLPVVITDAEKLRHILDNLINNAIKFADKGSVTISAIVKEGARQPVMNGGGESRWVEFRVSDTGVGIPDDALPSIFEKFRQLDSSETRPYEGVGLGLYIVKRYSDLLGGTIDVKSDLGKGSSFTVTIPYECGTQELAISDRLASGARGEREIRH